MCTGCCISDASAVMGLVLLGVVVVESAAGLSPPGSGCNHALQQFWWSEAWVTGCFVNTQPCAIRDVNTCQIGSGQRSHAVAETKFAGFIDVFGRSQARF